LKDFGSGPPFWPCSRLCRKPPPGPSLIAFPRYATHTLPLRNLHVKDVSRSVSLSDDDVLTNGGEADIPVAAVRALAVNVALVANLVEVAVLLRGRRIAIRNERT